ncbi:MAG TPA: hypothetical protein VK858_06230 [Longimicrobiales bacterium]|nr:hypothetical protein [Longimicrobiales bacterium]
MSGDREGDALGPLEELLARAQELGEEGDYDGMAEILRDALEDFPGEPALLCFLGVAEREQGLEGVAYERFRQALALDPEDPWILATAGNALAEFDDPEAEQALRAAAVMAPDLALARWLYGAYLAREGFHEQAREELDAARALEPDHAPIAYESGVAWALAGERSRAVDEMARAVEMDPGDAWARVVLGLLLVEDDRIDEALPELDMGARDREDDVEAQLAAALAHGVMGDEGSAWEFLERARMRARGTDTLAADEVEEQLGAGPAGPRRLLRQTLGPSLLRERLRART